MDFDRKYIVKVLEFLGHREVGGVTEARIITNERYIMINGKRTYVGSVDSGYYDDYQKLAKDIFDGKANIYVMINPCRPDLLARAANRLQFGAKVTTADDEILSDSWFAIDVDPIRPAGISSTQDELKLVLAKRDEVAEYLSNWAVTIKGMSGNGAHGLIKLKGYPNSEKTKQAKERLIKYLADRFSDETVSVDNTVFNMSRIWKLYGTMACKGDSIPSRPHRRSYLEIRDVEPVDLYSHISEIVPKEFLHEQRPKINSGNYPILDVPAYLNAWGGEWRAKKKGSVTWYQFKICPLHTDYDSDEWEYGICQYPNGKMGSKCMHDPSYGWQEFKAIIGDTKNFYLPNNAKLQ